MWYEMFENACVPDFTFIGTLVNEVLANLFWSKAPNDSHVWNVFTRQFFLLTWDDLATTRPAFILQHIHW